MQSVNKKILIKAILYSQSKNNARQYRYFLAEYNLLMKYTFAQLHQIVAAIANIEGVKA